ncbi:sigma-70 family RNA polymerase sigma factor [Pseudoteredinibacter isoporae]|uniref:sigma-70 family RNA polymerase sigma factor n=1 Tax=Pseudoteredinibacter isoporae TaxID=570281 RepID=UPI00310624E1
MSEAQVESVVEMDWNQCLEQIAITGDKRLFMKFYDHFSPRLHSWMLKLCADATLAEELCQEAFLQAWRKAASYEPRKASASTWLFTIARNLFIDAKRRHKVEQKHLHSLKSEDIQIEHFNLDSNTVKEAIAKLPHRQAQVIYQSYYLGHSHSEIAEIMGLPLGSIKSSIRLAFQKLCKDLDVTP